MQNFSQIRPAVRLVALTKVCEQTDGKPDKYAEPAGWHDHATDRQIHKLDQELRPLKFVDQ